MTPFADRLSVAINQVNSCLCVGIDPTFEQLPSFLKSGANASNIRESLQTFGEAIIEAVRGLVPAIKPNIAFFEQYGVAGIQAFNAICETGQRSGLVVVADIKRGDIGSTAAAYANAFIAGAPWGDARVAAVACDAITVNPSLGFDTVEPLISSAIAEQKGLFLLVRTSNPGAAQIQTQLSPLVARWISEQSHRLRGSSGLSGLGAVVGATSPAMAKELRGLMPEAIFLVPGYGAQGASAADALAGARSDGNGVLISASRGVIQHALQAKDRASFVAQVSVTTKTLVSDIRNARLA